MVLKAVIDTNIFIYLINRTAPYYAPSRSLLTYVDRGFLKVIIPTLVIAELSAGFHIFGDLERKEEVLTHFKTSPNYITASLTFELADLAGRIRADTGLRLPDAILVATGVQTGAEYIVSYDSELKRADQYIKALTPDALLREVMGGRPQGE